jgi:hypothetical protein
MGVHKIINLIFRVRCKTEGASLNESNLIGVGVKS